MAVLAVRGWCTGHVVRCERRVHMCCTDGVPVWRVGIGSTDGFVGPRLLDAFGSVPAGPVHIRRANSYERSCVPRCAFVRCLGGVRDARAESIIEPAVRYVPGGPLVRRQCDSNAMQRRMERGRWRRHVHQVR